MCFWLRWKEILELGERTGVWTPGSCSDGFLSVLASDLSFLLCQLWVLFGVWSGSWHRTLGIDGQWKGPSCWVHTWLRVLSSWVHAAAFGPGYEMQFLSQWSAISLISPNLYGFEFYPQEAHCAQWVASAGFIFPTNCPESLATDWTTSLHFLHRNLCCLVPPWGNSLFFLVIQESLLILPLFGAPFSPLSKRNRFFLDSYSTVNTIGIHIQMIILCYSWYECGHHQTSL